VEVCGKHACMEHMGQVATHGCEQGMVVKMHRRMTILLRAIVMADM